MGLTPRFTKDDVRRYLQQRWLRIEQSIIFNLQYLGEECVNKARAEGDYTDRTGNLRSSIGYVVVANGKIVHTGGFGGGYGDGGMNGTGTGEQYAQSIASKYIKGYALIVVAGMDYAAKVESTGKNVLSTAEHYAQKELPNMLSQLKNKAVK